MADNVVANAGSGGSTFATDDIAGVHYPRSKMVWGADGTATDASAAAPLPVVQTGTPALPTGAATEATLAAASAKLPATLGQKAMTASMAVVLASDQASIPVTGTFYQATQPVSGTVTANAGTGTMAVSLASVPSHAVTNAGTFAAQVDGAALTALQLIDNLVAIDDAAFTPASGSGTPIMGFADETSPDAVDEGDVGVVRMTLQRALHVNLRDASGNELSSGAQYAEDAVHASGDMLMMAGAVRRDTPVVSSGTDGDNSTLNVDATGRLYGNAAGAAAHDAAIAGNPVRVAGRAMSADYTAVATGDTADVLASLLGKQVFLTDALPANTWVYAAPAGGLVNTTGVTAKAAAGAGIRNYVSKAQVINSHQTIGTEVVIRDGAAGTVLWRGWAQFTGGGAEVEFKPPLRGTANTLIEIAEVTATGTAGVLVNLQGFVAAE